MLTWNELPSYRELENDNQNLVDQLRELQDENGRLFKLLGEKDFEIKHLKKKREEERLALAGIIPELTFFTTVMLEMRHSFFMTHPLHPCRHVGFGRGYSGHQDC